MAGLEDLLGGLAGGQGGTPDIGSLLSGLAGGEGGLDLGQLQSLAGPLLSQLQQSGGLDQVLGQLQDAGLGDAVQSWIGTGANQAVDPSAIADAVGPDQLQQLASQAGLSPEQASEGIAQLLPGLVNGMSPEGQLPDAGSAQDLLGQLGGLFGGQ